MTPQKAILILIAAILVVVGAFIAFYLLREQWAAEKEQINLNSIGDEENQKTSEEVKKEELVEQKIEEKMEEIAAEAKDRSYTQDEIDFILNPRATVEKELGLATTTATTTTAAGSQGKPLTQEEIDAILNPKR